jgi:AraC-like DNA-binding protein
MKGTTRQTRQQIKMIWALSHQRGLTAAALREWIEAVSGQASLRGLTSGQASQLIDGLLDQSKDVDAFRSNLARRVNHMTVAQQWLIKLLAGELGLSAHQVTGLVQHMYGRSPSEPLTRVQASGVIEALKAIRRRTA